MFLQELTWSGRQSGLPNIAKSSLLRHRVLGLPTEIREIHYEAISLRFNSLSEGIMGDSSHRPDCQSCDLIREIDSRKEHISYREMDLIQTKEIP